MLIGAISNSKLVAFCAENSLLTEKVWLTTISPVAAFVMLIRFAAALFCAENKTPFAELCCVKTCVPSTAILSAAKVVVKFVFTADCALAAKAKRVTRIVKIGFIV